MNEDVFKYCLDLIFDGVDIDKYEQLFRIICISPINEDDNEWNELRKYCTDKTKYKTYLRKALKYKAEKSIIENGKTVMK